MRTKIRLPEVTVKTVLSLVSHICEIVDSPRSLTVFLIIQGHLKGGGNCDELQLLTCNPSHYLSVEAFRDDYLVTEIIRKLQGLPLSTDPEAVAVEKFLEAERQCSVTNRRLRLWQDPDGRYDRLIDRMRKNLADMLGPVADDTISDSLTDGGWGKGVTSSVKGKWLSEYHKLEGEPQATPDLFPLAGAILTDLSSLLRDRQPGMVAGSKVAFVPKDARTHRSIAVEPSLNLYLQKGLGSVIRQRMRRRWGLDLNSQVRNQQLAREGSIDGSYATIDLSSASDTVACGLVERLLSPAWRQILGLARSKFTELEGRKHLLSKWSSMGNGYTFELETAIFAAAVKSVIPQRDWYQGRWAVYGDDIIVPTAYYEQVCDLLRYLGFTTNTRKTFADGPFRESCGADWFLGEQTRPIYLKKADWVTLVKLHNWWRAARPANSSLLIRICRIPPISDQLGLHTSASDSEEQRSGYVLVGRMTSDSTAIVRSQGLE